MALYSDVLLTVDYDRTLTAPDSSIPQRNLDAIRYFIENGGAFTVNTGRSVPMTKAFRDIVPVSAPLLLYNGSAAYDPATRTLTACHEIALDQYQTITKCLKLFPDLTVEIQGVDAHYLTQKDTGWEAYCENNRCAWSYEHPNTPFIKAALYGQFRENTVSSMYEATQEELQLFDAAIRYITEKYGHQVELFRACARILDIHAKGSSKGNAARALQQRLGKKILVCVGDAENDILMLDSADYAYCPADGILANRYENVCECAKGAVADVIYKKIPAILHNQP